MSGRPAPWVDLLRLLSNGQNVDEIDGNVPHRDLEQRTQHLKDLLDQLNAGEGIYYRSVPLASEVEIGQPVYLNHTTSEFEQALAAIDYDEFGNYGPVAESSYVWGVVTYKETATVGDILVTGVLRDVDMSTVIQDTSVSGAYYLSTLEAGKLSKQKPPVSVYVLYWWAGEQVGIVMPTPREILEDHIHYRFELLAQPAGVPNCPDFGELHKIIVPDPDIEGWLPADHEIFQGVAPPGAKFGYNLAKSEELSRVFPPIPIDSWYVEVYEGVQSTGRDPAIDVLVDNNGIWWMNDCYGLAPWPTYWEPCSSSSLSSEMCRPPDLNHLVGHGLPSYPYPMAIYFWFTKMVYKTDSSVVSKLLSESAALRFYRCGTTTEASTGPLEAHLDLGFAVEDPPQAGPLAFKEIEGEKFQRGYVVEKIKSNSPNIVVTGTHDEVDSEGDPTGYKQAAILLDFVDPSTSARELDIQLVALNNARQDEYQGVLYYGFLTGRESSIRCRVDIPSIGFPDTTNTQIKLRILGTAAGILPDLGFSYLRVPAAADPADLPTGDTVLGDIMLSAEGAVTANQYFDILSEAFEVAVGDTIFFTISRGASDTYAGTVGVLRQKGITVGA